MSLSKSLRMTASSSSVASMSITSGAPSIEVRRDRAPEVTDAVFRTRYGTPGIGTFGVASTTFASGWEGPRVEVESS